MVGRCVRWSGVSGDRLSLKLSLPASKIGFSSQQQPTCSIEEVIETRGFARKTTVHLQVYVTKTKTPNSEGDGDTRSGRS
jgi:hypothetical protein